MMAVPQVQEDVALGTGSEGLLDLLPERLVGFVRAGPVRRADASLGEMVALAAVAVLLLNLSQMAVLVVRAGTNWVGAFSGRCEGASQRQVQSAWVGLVASIGGQAPWPGCSPGWPVCPKVMSERQVA